MILIEFKYLWLVHSLDFSSFNSLLIKEVAKTMTNYIILSYVLNPCVIPAVVSLSTEHLQLKPQAAAVCQGFLLIQPVLAWVSEISFLSFLCCGNNKKKPKPKNSALIPDNVG